jgi:hypothetical protein
MLAVQPLRGENENLSYLPSTSKMQSRWQMSYEVNEENKKASS